MLWGCTSCVLRWVPSGTSAVPCRCHRFHQPLGGAAGGGALLLVVTIRSTPRVRLIGDTDAAYLECYALTAASITSSGYAIPSQPLSLHTCCAYLETMEGRYAVHHPLADPAPLWPLALSPPCSCAPPSRVYATLWCCG